LLLFQPDFADGSADVLMGPVEIKAARELGQRRRRV